MTTMDETETAAITADAERRLAELVAVKKVLLPDADDAAVLSELTEVESQIAAAERVLG